MTLNLTYVIVMSWYVLFAFTVTLTVFSLIPMPAERSHILILVRRVGIAVMTAALSVIPGVMQHLLTVHPVYYSIGLALILFQILRKGFSVKRLWSMTLLCSTLILSNCLQRHQAEIVAHLRLAHVLSD